MRSAPTDQDRWLTDTGRRTVTKVGKALARLGLQYSCIYTSPLVRAVQTAEILAATHPDFRGPLEVQSALSSEAGSTAQALEPLEHAADDDLLVMVTHMPKVGVLAGHLCQLATFPSFRTSSACLLSLEGGKGRFQWMLDPETLELKHP
ncbi:MAG: histidine phosphatase family protein [Deltaproteobacteria bacterium]|nr:histidine phosphatase family protein [Deltaproteobacteria bacterium]